MSATASVYSRTISFIKKTLSISNLINQGSLVKEDYNMRVKATPIGTIGSLLRKTPLVGRQIERLRKAILTFNFNVTGSFGDPNVQLTEVESLNPKKNE